MLKCILYLNNTRLNEKCGKSGYVNIYLIRFSFCDHARVLFISKNQLFALKYTLKRSLIKTN